MTAVAPTPAQGEGRLGQSSYRRIGGVVKINRFLTVLLGSLTVILASASIWAQQAPQEPIILKGSPMGAVKFTHKTHTPVAGKCEICHHASKPQKPLKSPQEACIDCHTTPATPPVTRNLQGAFHTPTASSGLCIDCHKKQNAAGKAAPVKCIECHQKANG